jgi:tRNA threonylcarbamoyl adenosine modification protein YeaZ
MDARTKMNATDQTSTWLAIETATPVCSVVLQVAGQIYEKRATGRAVHSEKLFAFIQELLTDHALGVDDLDAVLVSAGPGSYTGLRIAASGVKGLLFEREVPLMAIHTLAGFARLVVDEHHSSEKAIHAVIDARRSHLYHAAYRWSDQGRLEVEESADVRELSEVEQRVSKEGVLIGTGQQRLETINPDVIQKGEEAISAHGLIQLMADHKTKEYPNSIITEVDVAHFDPRYYTTNQIEQKSS